MVSLANNKSKYGSSNTEKDKISNSQLFFRNKVNAKKWSS